MNTEKLQAQWHRDEASIRARIAALPDVFVDRFQRFEEHCGEDWMVSHLGYELFVCEQAVAIADSGIDLDVLMGAPFVKQRRLIPALSDEHSGNTFGMACRMANTYRERPDLVPFEHAAIHGLLGCEEAGCWTARRERTGEELPQDPT